MTAIHDLSLASRYADTMVLLNQGKIISAGLPQDVLNSQNIEQSYGVSALVYQDPLTGKTTLSTNDEHRNTVDFESEATVHVICGGGTGGRLIHSLKEAGLIVTAGPLGSGDTDRMVADILGVNYIPTMAFAPIGTDVFSIHGEMVKDADLVILCDMPISPNNVKNLEAAKLANNLIVFGESELGERDLTEGLASVIYRELKPSYRNSNVDSVVAKVQSIVNPAK